MTLRDKILLAFGAAIVLVAVTVGFHVAPAQTACPTGNEIISNNGATGCGNLPSNATVYNSSGLVSSPKVWVGTATVNSSGAWSVSIAAAGFTTIQNVQVSPTASSNSGIVANAAYSCTTTSCSGTIVGASNVLGILTLALTSVSGSTVSIQIYGN